MIRLAVLLALAAASADAVPAAKRGVGAKDLSEADWNALRPGVSWWYNWHFEPDSTVPAGGPEFVPMLWGDHAGQWAGLAAALKRTPLPRVILGLNEPNLRSQANLTPEAAAKAWMRLRKLAAAAGVPLSGPQLATWWFDPEKAAAIDAKRGNGQKK